MITKVVIDTNLALKWIPGEGEKDVDIARRVYSIVKTKDIEMWAPDFLLVESLQVFLNKRMMPLNDAINGVEELRHCGLIFELIGYEDLKETGEIADKYKQSVYDAIFLYMARKINCKVVTFDERMWKKSDLAMSPRKFLEMVEN